MAKQSVTKNMQGHGYKYADIKAVNDYIEEIGETYRQEIETAPNGFDYVITIRIKGDKETRCRGCKVPEARLPQNKANPAQEYGSGLTYARRYSLYMAYGLATEDDDGESLTIQNPPAGYQNSQYQQQAPVEKRPWRRACMQLANANQIALEDVSMQYGLKPNDTEENYKRAYEQMQKDLSK